MKKNTITLDKKSLILNGERLVLMGGEFHYFRTPRDCWEERLKQMKQAGCNLVTTYIPWNWHEEKEGVLNWEGDRDVNYFLQLCKKYDQYVIIKPGPYICAEWDFGGFPDWILQKNVPIRVPEKNYLKLVKAWYNEVAKVILPNLITNDGTIVLIQVENEYAHILRYTDEIDSDEEAKGYLLTLLDYVRETGIDVPAFTNDGPFIHGTEINDARTYYPNIPWFWKWEFDPFELTIEENIEQQGDKPLMILEIETGWFAENNRDFFNVESEVMEGILKSVYMYGSSISNLYMLIGGTTYGGWISRGDRGGIGNCNTYDFDAPVREWGAVGKKYNILRLFNYFTFDFSDILLNGIIENDDVSIISGAENIFRLYLDRVENPKTFDNTNAKIKIMLRRTDNASILYFRNLDEDNKKVQFSLKSKLLNKEINLPSTNMNVDSHNSLLLPVDFKINDDLQMIYATSELIAKRTVNDEEYLILRGNENIAGEIAFKGKVNISVLNNDVKSKYDDNGFTLLEFSHKNITLLKLNNTKILIVPNNMALDLTLDTNKILISDNYYIATSGDNILELKYTPSKESKKTMLWSDDIINSIKIDNNNIKVSNNESLGCYMFEHTMDENIDNSIPKWSNQWKCKSDVEELDNDYDYSNWNTIQANTSLEKAGYLDHKFFWFKQDFNLPENAKNATLELNENQIDRLTIFINGKAAKVGIELNKVDISELVQTGGNIITIRYENAYHTKAHPAEGPLLKHSGLYQEGARVTFDINDDVKDINFKDWKIQDGMGGDLKGYANKDFDDSKWLSIPDNNQFISTPEVGSILWLRRNFTFNKIDNWEAPIFIELEEVTARCYLYVNGFFLARYENSGPQRKFYIPNELLQENNTIALMIEGPTLHEHVPLQFEPIKFKGPEFGFYFTSKKVICELNN